jgi:hypothetical protein
MSVLLFRSLGMFGAKGKCFLITVVTLLFGFFLIIPSALRPAPCLCAPWGWERVR